MELAFCNRFWNLILVTFSFFIFLIVIPVTVSLISHLILTISILLLFSWTFFFAIKIIALLIWSSLLFTTSIYRSLCWCRSSRLDCFSRSSFKYFSSCCLCLNWLFSSILAFLCLFSCLSLFETLLARTCILRILLCLQSCCPSLKVNFGTLRLWAVLTGKSLMILTIPTAILTTIITTVIATLFATIVSLAVMTITLITFLLVRILWLPILLLLTTLCLFLGTRFTLCLKISTLWSSWSRFSWSFSGRCFGSFWPFFFSRNHFLLDWSSWFFSYFFGCGLDSRFFLWKRLSNFFSREASLDALACFFFYAGRMAFDF